MSYSIEFSKSALNDLNYWRKTGDKKVLKRIFRILKSIEQTPFRGIGNPEPLKHELAGYWSRRITAEHRLAYTLRDRTVYVIAMRYHYN